MYNLGDYVVCPGHGVGQVVGSETKETSEGIQTEYYLIKLVSNGMRMMIPKESKEGVRALVTSSEVEEVFKLLGNHDVKVDNSTWNRRQRDYVGKLKTGSLLEIADVLRSLLLLKVSKKLSFGEKKMLDQCKELLIQEIALAKGDEAKQVDSKIESCFS
ncbi:MAG: CarD family transcriptional regulator [Bacteriovoracaceae bacterium]|nr:CarD family transcriptional regulator [Bacteriovoracaceae bacterium]